MSERETGSRSAANGETVRRSNPDRIPSESSKWLSALIALVGIWMIAEAFLFELAGAQLWNDLAIGLLLLAVGGYNYYRQSNEQFGSVNAAAVAAVIGLWLIAAPFVFSGGAGGSTGVAVGVWNDLVAGLVTFVLGAYSAYKIRNWQQTTGAAA
jgi:hypothetical protein